MLNPNVQSIKSFFLRRCWMAETPFFNGTPTYTPTYPNDIPPSHELSTSLIIKSHLSSYIPRKLVVYIPIEWACLKIWYCILVYSI